MFFLLNLIWTDCNNFQLKKNQSLFHKISKEIKYLPGIVAMFHLHRIFLPAVSISPCVLGTDFSLRHHTNVFPGTMMDSLPPIAECNSSKVANLCEPLVYIGSHQQHCLIQNSESMLYCEDAKVAHVFINPDRESCFLAVHGQSVPEGARNATLLSRF